MDLLKGCLIDWLIDWLINWLSDCIIVVCLLIGVMCQLPARFMSALVLSILV